MKVASHVFTPELFVNLVLFHQIENLVGEVVFRNVRADELEKCVKFRVIFLFVCTCIIKDSVRIVIEYFFGVVLKDSLCFVARLAEIERVFLADKDDKAFFQIFYASAFCRSGIV